MSSAWVDSFQMSLMSSGGAPVDHPLVKDYAVLTDACWAFATRLRDEVIVPLCRRRRWTFAAGNGTWGFWDRNGRLMDNDRIPADAYALLEGIQAPNGYPLAAYCDDYPMATKATP